MSPVTFPKIPPEGIEQNAQPPGRAATGKENPSAVFKRMHDCLLDFPCPARLDEFAVSADHIVIDAKEQFQPGDDVLPRDLTQIGCQRVGRFGDECAQVELVADV